MTDPIELIAKTIDPVPFDESYRFHRWLGPHRQAARKTAQRVVDVLRAHGWVIADENLSPIEIARVVAENLEG